MNAIAYMEGAATINDTPDCVWAPLAGMAIVLNDNICDHNKEEFLLVDPDGDHPLCPSCTHEMWMAGVGLIGTAEAVSHLDHEQQHTLLVQMAAHLFAALWNTIETPASGLPASRVASMRRKAQYDEVLNYTISAVSDPEGVRAGKIIRNTHALGIFEHLADSLVRLSEKRAVQTAAALFAVFWRHAFYLRHEGSMSVLLAELPTLVDIVYDASRVNRPQFDTAKIDKVPTGRVTVPA